MSGIDFLVEARDIYPEAGRVLLTTYADAEAAIAGINDVGIHHYLVKPGPARRAALPGLG